MSENDIPERPIAVRSRRKRKKRLLLGGLAGVAVFVAMFIVYLNHYPDRDLQETVAIADPLDPGWRIPPAEDNKKLQEAIREADKLDPDWRLADLEKKRAVISDEKNAALVLMAARKLLPDQWPSWPPRRAAGHPISDEILWSLDEPVQLDQGQIKALRQELRRAEKALVAVRKVATLPRGRWPIQDRAGLATIMPFRRGLADLLAYDVLLHAQEQEVNGALASCQALLNCGRAIGDDPSLFSMLIRDDLRFRASKNVERTLVQGEPTEAELAPIQRTLEEEAEQPLLLIAARGERGEMDEALRTIQEGTLPFSETKQMLLNAAWPDSMELLSVTGLRSENAAKVARTLRPILLEHSNRFVEIAKLPVEQQIARSKELQVEIPNFPTLSRWCSSHTTKLAARFHRSRAKLRCAVVMVAAERYRRAKNRWPPGLSDLVPAYVSKVPPDPFNEKPLRIRRFDDGVVIYSVGPDRQDNGGKLDKDPEKPGTDLGFRLWDVPKRRQPSK